MTDPLFDISGKTALVTGGYKGVGRMIAEGFLRRGVRTYITGRKAEPCIKAADELSALGECRAIPNDLSTLDGVQELADAIAERESSLDILVNNAGTGWHTPFDEFPEAGWDKTMAVNLRAPFFLTQKLAPLLRKAASPERPAKVVNISSVDALYTPADDGFPYPASKAGLVHLTRKLASILAPDHVIVNSICPGAFASDMNPMAREHPEEMGKYMPAQRVGTPEDIAGSVIYLVSRAGDFTVGTNLTVDGGYIYARGGA